MSTNLVHTGINLMILIAIASVVFALVVGIGSQITANTPTPAANTLLYNLTKTFDAAVNQGASLLGPLLLIGFGVIVILGVAYIWRIFGGGGGGLGR
jgi:NADH:ubiquinone oxidoreductase subunit 3 (subunit A)